MAHIDLSEDACAAGHYPLPCQCNCVESRNVARRKHDRGRTQCLPIQPPSTRRNPPPPRKTIFYTLDGIRGIAALLVVMRHTERLFTPLRMQESYLAVDIFFVLSGVVIAQAYGKRLAHEMRFREFVALRAIRIMPLYLLGTAISVAAALTGLEYAGSPGMLAYFTALALFMLPNPGIFSIDVYPLNNPAWSLPLELAVNAFYAGFIKHLTTSRIILIMAASACGIVFTLVAAKSHSLNIGFWARSFPFGVFRVGYSFFAGVILFQIYDRSRGFSAPLPARINAIRNKLALAALAVTALALGAAPPPSVQPFYDFFAVTLLFPVGMLAQPDAATARICRFLGLISYAVYTLHAPLSGALDGAFHAVTGTALAAYAPLIGGAFMVLLVPLCAAADKYYDFPVRRALLRRWAAAAPAHTPREGTVIVV
jgi:peptidoglycan/LPS O-acetylase OafA/YrhL